MPKGVFQRHQKTPEEIEARFWSKIFKTKTCWIWKGALRSTDHSKGYGNCIWKGRNRGAHIVAYELLIGPVPAGMELDHKCRNSHCVNPSHLEPVTHFENVIVRGQGPFAQRARQTHCKRGHEFTPENTYIHKSRRVRICRTCHNARVNADKKLLRQNESPEQRQKRLSYFARLRATPEYKQKFNAYRKARRARMKAAAST